MHVLSSSRTVELCILPLSQTSKCTIKNCTKKMIIKVCVYIVLRLKFKQCAKLKRESIEIPTSYKKERKRVHAVYQSGFDAV